LEWGIDGVEADGGPDKLEEVGEGAGEGERRDVPRVEAVVVVEVVVVVLLTEAVEFAVCKWSVKEAGASEGRGPFR
jgi:hypothetical protein